MNDITVPMNNDRMPPIGLPAASPAARTAWAWRLGTKVLACGPFLARLRHDGCDGALAWLAAQRASSGRTAGVALAEAFG